MSPPSAAWPGLVGLDVADPDRYAQRWAHAETLIVGGGPAGLAAALAASRTGERIILCDQDPHFGGALHSDAGATIDDAPARAWIERVVAELSASPSVRLLPRTTAFGYGIDNLVTLAQRCDDSGTEARERQWLVRAGRVILATGSIERPLLFRTTIGPASCWRARHGPSCIALAWRRGAWSPYWPRTTAAIEPRSIWRRPGQG